MAAEKRRNTGRARTNDNRTPRAQYVPNVQAQPFIPITQGSLNNPTEVRLPNVPPPNASQKNTTTPTDTRHDSAEATLSYFPLSYCMSQTNAINANI